MPGILREQIGRLLFGILPQRPARWLCSRAVPSQDLVKSEYFRRQTGYFAPKPGKCCIGV